jgi:hypothetical protein
LNRLSGRRGGAGLVLPFCNTEAMSLHLTEISLMVAPGAHAVVLMDQAGWHTTDKLEVPSNISIIALPAKCPELNPVENIWQFMRDNWLSNRVFTSHDNIVDHCCEAWNKRIVVLPHVILLPIASAMMLLFRCDISCARRLRAARSRRAQVAAGRSVSTVLSRA